MSEKCSRCYNPECRADEIDSGDIDHRRANRLASACNARRMAWLERKLDRVRIVATRAASMGWRDLLEDPAISDPSSVAYGMNSVGEDICDILEEQ